ncbi:2-C-methyl-D-erythritol 4-phosphate cytidylyltransferase [Fusobacterium gonidiaformans 3-1-5R]|uniref:2-C-methyl-D-erythritol 4-phosphate cytidylyltransferase n=2 Tax=Fusobacterium TaxID=848 RepID=E5BHL0_9FUSO|nr:MULTISPECIES: 2-C-methyl-D-erythritol 4-phosphate cytidylyltransferase [Fusobacterium]AVQ16229.1 2-C-methyl-D-erythritol 4-phosphate cytidylyltransferase [Fusobacterium gonidiaformans ATCC 25563]EFS21983.1 2-C-methyl-D-erythritol 4-phosphate cytidylyltransferase [Fusobacterium gonidiaformans 3-1-5R]EFS28552.1 2-C-methyl-D-erythritol 4-phosphate cytidylyltransferase [Fusobacterium gonidiaformans ATCC 25563]KXA14236.1 2-C-methyl-D-erythritol 4-phosphate cytidylyltransferase [Fusobacterium equi
MHCGYSKIKKKMSFILACAGIGKRMKLGYPKQFLEYDGKPLFLKPLLCAEQSEYVDEIIIVSQEEYLEDIKTLCQKEGIHKLKAVVTGGRERQDSIFAALKKVSIDMDYVMVQDAVRPFCKEKYIRESYEQLEAGYMGTVVGVAVKDTIKEITEDGFVKNTPKRSSLFAAHTPQAFQKEILKEAYEKAYQDKFLGTDDASLVERLQLSIKIIVGDYDNIKITTPEDLKILNP